MCHEVVTITMIMAFFVSIKMYTDGERDDTGTICTPATFACLLRRKRYFLTNDLTFEAKEIHAAQMLSRDALVSRCQVWFQMATHIMQTLETLCILQRKLIVCFRLEYFDVQLLIYYSAYLRLDVCLLLVQTGYISDKHNLNITSILNCVDAIMFLFFHMVKFKNRDNSVTKSSPLRA